jgi:MFS family permease
MGRYTEGAMAGEHPQRSGLAAALADPVARARRIYYGWYLVGAGVVVGFLGALNNYGFGVLFLPITRELDLTRAQTSLVFSAARLEGGLEAPVSGWLTDRLGPRVMLLAGNTLTGVGFILLGTVVNNFWSLFVVWVFLTSLGFQTGFFTGVMAAMNTWFIRHRSKAISFISSSNRVGGFIWTPLLGFIVAATDWHTAAVIAGIVILVAGTPLCFLFRRSPESMGLLPDGDTLQSSGPHREGRVRNAPTATGVDFTVREALRTRTFWFIALAQFCRMLSFGAISVHMIPMFVWKGQGELAAAGLASIVPLIGIPMTLVFGQLGDRYSIRHILAIGTGVSALGMMTLAFGGSVLWLYAFVVFYGIGEAATPLIPSMTGYYFGRKSFATLRGILNFVTVIGPFAAPVYAGWVFDTTSSYVWALIPFFIFKALAVPLYLLMPRPPARPSQPAPTTT